MVLLLCPLGLELLLTKSISLWKALKCCIGIALLSIGLTIMVDSVMWKKLVWPEFEVLWFNSVLNRSYEWGTHSFHWYFTSALPRSLLAAYPLCILGVLHDRRVLPFIIPVFSFVLLYSKLPHKELRFIVCSVPIFNLSAAVAASRILGCTAISFMASYKNYPSGYAMKYLHRIEIFFFMTSDLANNIEEEWVHIDTFSVMNGISRFCENDFLRRYFKEESISLKEFHKRNFTYLINEHSFVDGYKCLFTVDGFSRVRPQLSFPPILLIKDPKVYVHGNIKNKDLMNKNWPGCS